MERNPGAFIGAKPLAAWRQRGLWPESYDRLLAQLIERHGKASGTRQMIQLLSLIRPHGHPRVRAAAEAALTPGAAEAGAARHLLEARRRAHVADGISRAAPPSAVKQPQAR